MSGRGPRRQVLDLLRAPDQRVRWLKSRWTVASTVYLAPGERGRDADTWKRPRRPHEYPENEAEAWTDLAEQAGAAITELGELQRYAREQLERLEPS